MNFTQHTCKILKDFSPTVTLVWLLFKVKRAQLQIRELRTLITNNYKSEFLCVTFQNSSFWFVISVYFNQRRTQSPVHLEFKWSIRDCSPDACLGGVLEGAAREESFQLEWFMGDLIELITHGLGPGEFSSVQRIIYVLVAYRRIGRFINIPNSYISSWLPSIYNNLHFNGHNELHLSENFLHIQLCVTNNKSDIKLFSNIILLTLCCSIKQWEWSNSPNFF